MDAVLETAENANAANQEPLNPLNIAQINAAVTLQSVRTEIQIQ